MRLTNICPKCQGSQILRTKGAAFDQDGNKIRYSIFKKIPLDHFTCVDCGYTEEWVTDQKHLQFLRNKYGKGKSDNEYSDFV